MGCTSRSLAIALRKSGSREAGMLRPYPAHKDKRNQQRFVRGEHCGFRSVVVVAEKVENAPQSFYVFHDRAAFVTFQSPIHKWISLSHTSRRLLKFVQVDSRRWLRLLLNNRAERPLAKTYAPHRSYVRQSWKCHHIYRFIRRILAFFAS